MSKSKSNSRKTFEDAGNPQQKLRNAVADGMPGDSGAGTPHSSRKEALGPNTKRK